MELEIMMGGKNSLLQASPLKLSVYNKGLRFNSRVMAYDDDYDDNILYTDPFRLNLAIRNLMKTANNKLNILVNGNSLKRDSCTIVKVYGIFLKIHCKTVVEGK